MAEDMEIEDIGPIAELETQTDKRDELLVQFQEVSGIENIEECRNYLESTGWNLENAMNLFYGSDSGGTSFNHVTPEQPSHAQAAGSSRNHVTFDYQHDFLVPKQPREANPFEALITTNKSITDSIPAPKSKKIRKPPFRPSRVDESWKNLDDDEDDDDDDDDKRPMPDGRIIQFRIEYAGRSADLSLDDSETIGSLKERVAKIFHKKDPNKLIFRGWPKGVCQVAEIPESVLKELKLPKRVQLYMGTSDAFDDDVNEVLLAKKFKLVVHDITNQERHEVFVNGAKTIAELKADVYSLTRIPPSRQLWSGLPVEASSDDMVLGHCGLDTPVHNLTVERLHVASGSDKQPLKRRKMPEVTEEEEKEKQESSGLASGDQKTEKSRKSSATKKTESTQETEGSDSEDDSFVDWDDSLNSSGAQAFLEEGNGSRENDLPLIPEEFRSPQDALENFVRVFEARYGGMHPQFFIGRLDDAIYECFNKDLQERRPLAVYLHHDGSVASNIFCTQVLCSEEVCNVLSANFVVWPWDMTSNENSLRLLEWVGHNLSADAQEFIRMRPPESYPMLILIAKHRGTIEMLGLGQIKPQMSADEVMLYLVQAQEQFAEMIRVSQSDEKERMERDMFRQEQELAFQESLEQDRLKAIERQRIEEEKRLEEMKIREEEDIKMAKQESLAARLPDEPEETCADPLATIRLRCPDGTVVTRRFLASEKLETLFVYAASKGFPIEEFKIVTSFPKRDVRNS